MPTPLEFAARAAGTPGARRWHRCRSALTDRRRRTAFVTAAAVPGHLALAAWKASVFVLAPSAFLLANVLFTLALAGVKTVAVIAHRRGGGASRNPGAHPNAEAGAYRAAGWTVLGCSVLYVVACVPMLLRTERADAYEHSVALAIATVAFFELGFSLYGYVSARRSADVVQEAVKLTSLAAALILLVLTQTALLSLTPLEEADPTRYNGLCGVLLGSLAAAIGGRMVMRAGQCNSSVSTVDTGTVETPTAECDPAHTSRVH
ncbi:hypothetical protein ACFYVR_18860 [Rhodococcus sp. NPDC003318]|uniref:hypothetical protein n=1 Tax=Rhodococcus sp. NPDC003318 TaxID=3364503 RepID=UPI00367765CC